MMISLTTTQVLLITPRAAIKAALVAAVAAIRTAVKATADTKTVTKAEVVVTTKTVVRVEAAVEAAIRTVKEAAAATQAVVAEATTNKVAASPTTRKVGIHAYKEQFCSINGIDSEIEANETAVRQEIAQMRLLTIRPYHQDIVEIPISGSNPLFIGCKDYRTAKVADQSGEVFTFAEYMKTQAGCGQAFVTSQNPGKEEIGKILYEYEENQYTAVIYGLYNGHIKTGQLELAKAIAAKAADQMCPMAAVALMDPYDLDEMPENVVRIAGWEYSKPQFQQIWKYLNWNGRKEE